MLHFRSSLYNLWNIDVTSNVICRNTSRTTISLSSGYRELVQPLDSGYSQLNSDFLSLLGWDSFGEYPAWAHAPHSTQFNNTCSPELFSTNRSPVELRDIKFFLKIFHFWRSLRIDSHQMHMRREFIRNYMRRAFVEIIDTKYVEG